MKIKTLLGLMAVIPLAAVLTGCNQNGNSEYNSTNSTESVSTNYSGGYGDTNMPGGMTNNSNWNTNSGYGMTNSYGMTNNMSPGYTNTPPQ